jgi:gamma-glutamyl:cysteine ligase YbdK (ATP-grasp superfamily)
MQFQFGIEHEVAFLNAAGQFADFTNTTFEIFDRIIQTLPHCSEDNIYLRVGDSGIRKKRWYIEGFERFSEEGRLIDCLPKGIEIRTSVYGEIHQVVAALSHDYQLLVEAAFLQGFNPIPISFNPQQTAFTPDPPLNDYEQSQGYGEPSEQLPMLSYGPDLNFSFTPWSPEQLIDIGQKLTFYSPYLLPFSYSSPYYGGKRWHGLSVRTYQRSPIRPVVLVYLENIEDFEARQIPWLRQAKSVTESGRIEFKAFDTCGDFSVYQALLTLLKGLVIDRNLMGRAILPDVELHQRSAVQGFHCETIRAGMQEILAQVKQVLDREELDRLKPIEHLILNI